MVRDLRYIIKRIIIGVGVGLCMYFLRNFLFFNCYALNIDSHNFTSQNDVLNNMNWETFYQGYDFWKDWGSGYIRFSFAILKKAQGNPTNTTPVIVPRTAIIESGSTNYVCDIGSVNTQNSTYNGQVYSAMCPVNFKDGHGLSRIHIYFQDQQANDYNEARVNFGGDVTFEQPSSFDMSGSIANDNFNASANNINRNQNFGNLIDDNRANAKANNDNRDKNTKKITDTLTNDDTTEANSKGTNFFNNFQSDSHGLSGIITAPLRLINSLTTATCNPLEFNLPIIHDHVKLPCIRPILEEHFGIFFSLYQLITTGLISYSVCINLYSKVRALQNPNNDRIEVLNL